MPAKRPLWDKCTINLNYLINIIHLQASLVITPARASGTAGEKRDSANLSECLTLYIMCTNYYTWIINN